uniref:A kinase (PRKA) anchor protein 9 n=1 Tax=Pundamilia nyererei TaxID=303518 RepID=A0A3B4FRC8_9CICH
MEEKDNEIALLNEQITKLQHMETTSDNKVMQNRDELIKDLESQVECLRSEQERLKRKNEEELDQLNEVIEKLQQELANIEQKQPTEEEEDTKAESEGDACGPSKDEYDKMKQRMDLATKELEALKKEHSKLLETYLRLKESAEALAETENLESSEGELEEALREKTAGLVVLQAQVQALEESASSRVEELGVRIEELEGLVSEKDSEISHCRFLLEQSQSHAEDLQKKMLNLEEHLREKVAAALVSQATLEAFQQQSVETRQEQDPQKPPEPHVEPQSYEFGDFGIPQMDVSRLGQQTQVPTGKVVRLTQKLRELEVGLSGMQKDQELQKQLLSSSEEEVLEYERRLTVLVDLLSQMKAGTHQRTSGFRSSSKSYMEHNEKLQEELQVSEGSVSKLKEELQEVRKSMDTTKEELNSYMEHNEKLQEELQVMSEGSVSKLKEELQEVRKSMDTTKEELNSYKQHNENLHKELHTPNSQLVKEAAPKTKHLSPEKTPPLLEMEEVIGEYEEKIVQMQELHAAEILDMEARHISESENLRRDTQALEDECKALKAVIEKVRSAEVRKRDVLDVYSSSDYSQRTGYDLPSLQQEFRTTPEGARRDEPLPDRIKTLLREVHQEGMQVLSLSELPLSESEPGDRFNVQGWVKERDALLDTIESLKNFISQMQTHRESQMSGSVDWRGELLDAVRQVFIKERNVLKNALYSQLDLLDTSDAIIHLNQLERRLAEVHFAENKSFCILYLLNVCLRPSGARSAVSLAGEGSIKEQRERVGADGAGGADRLLVEELKGELSQTKLELETTLKAQHKHLKELDTLRAEVSQKAAEVDALNDELTEERKKSRDLQWAMEKEKCQTGRTEESRREELEDLQLSLEEQKNHVAQLKLTVEQERQASSQLSHQAEEERLSLHRRLQELQVQLETERAKAQEMSTALGRERDLRTGVSSDGGHLHEEQVQKDGRSSEEGGGLLERLQRELDDKHAQVRCYSCFNCLMTPDFKAFYQWLGSDCIMIKHGFPLQVVDLLSQVEAQKLEQAVWHSDSTDRTKDWVLQQKSGNLHTESSSASPHKEVSSTGHSSGRNTHSLLVSSQNQLFASAFTKQHLLSFTRGCDCLSCFPQSASLLAGGSSSSSNTLTERLLRQNAELTGFVSRLTEEKNDLRNHTLRLEEELRRYRQVGLGRRGASKMDSAGLLLSQEREAWAREKIRLEKALHLAQSQVARLRGEIRSENLREITGPDADNAALKRMYGKYLRSESFRKALIYQKKYLLLMLGGFQECEEATLSLLTRMGGRPSLSSLESLSQRCRGAMRFRSIARVSIALSRMRFLVKRWHRATGMSSTASCAVSTEARDSPYLHPGGPEMYRDRGSGGGGMSSSRGRSGRESPRSAVSSTHHRFHMSGDHGPLTCSHLQNYDPDRALTDYISRLEALQRRLGSVTSGASSYAQLHFGLRR